MSVRSFPTLASPSVTWAGLYWCVLAACIMPCVAFLKPMELLAVGVLAFAATAAFVAPSARGPAVISLVAFYPRTVEYDSHWSLVLGMREPSPDVRIPALVSPLDAALVLLALSVLLPKCLRREPAKASTGPWGVTLLGALACSSLLAGGTYGPPYDSEFLTWMNVVRIAAVWVVLADACAKTPAVAAVAFLACSIAMASSGIWNYLTDIASGSAADLWYARGQAFNMNSNSFSATMLMSGSMALVWASTTRDSWQRIAGLIVFAVSAVGIGVALSRAGILLFVILTTAMLMVHRRHWLIPWFIALGLAVAYVVGAPELNSRVSLLQSGGAALEDHSRSLIYPQAWAMFLDNWLLGVGPYRFFDASIPYLPVGLYQYAAHAHSLPLQMLVDVGVLGSLFAVFFAWRLLRFASRNLRIRTHREWRIGAAWAACAALLMQLTDSLYIDYRFFALWMVPIAVLATAPRDRLS